MCLGKDGEDEAVVDTHKDFAGNEKDDDDASYFKLMKNYRCFRLYILSYIITHIGEWFTYIASIALVEELLGAGAPKSRTTISILVVVRLLPNVLLSPFGGILADGWDRRVSMIVLDIVGAICPLLFFLAMHFESINLIYLVTFIQQCVAGLYEPCRSAIVPQLVPEEDYLKKATTLAGLCWSLFAAVGSSLGGFALTAVGFKACFLMDSCTYLISAFLMWLVGGVWNVAPDNDVKVVESIFQQIHGMAFDGVKYLHASFWGALVFLKATGGIIYGAADVLNVTFSEPNGIKDNNSSARLGLLFACVGIGCFVGPLIADRFTNMKKPSSLQMACIVAIGLMSIGWIGVGIFQPFWSICAFTVMRALGSSTNWIFSSLLLQKFCGDNMMGRVLSIDYALALLAETMTAYMAGALQDNLNLSAYHIAFFVAGIGGILTVLWIVYHLLGRGAADETSDYSSNDEEMEAEMTELVSQHL